MGSKLIETSVLLNTVLPVYSIKTQNSGHNWDPALCPVTLSEVILYRACIATRVPFVGRFEAKVSLHVHIIIVPSVITASHTYYVT